MILPQGTLLMTGNKLFIQFDNQEDAEAVFEFLERYMNEPFPTQEEDIRQQHGGQRQAIQEE